MEDKNMKKNILFKTFGCVTLIVSFGLIACGDDSSSNPISNTPSCTALTPECGVPYESSSSPVVDNSSDAGITSSDAASSSSIVLSSSSIENVESSSSVVKPNSSNSGEMCIHMSDIPADSDSDPWCFNQEGQHAVDCFTHEAYLCAKGFWVPAQDCDTTKERCGFDDYKLCTKFGIDEFCNDKWLNEPCSEEDGSRDFHRRDSTGAETNGFINYICVDGKWVDRFSLYECSTGKNCGGTSKAECRTNDIIGTACDEKDRENSWITKDGCEFQCRDGKYEFVPPPVY